MGSAPKVSPCLGDRPRVDSRSVGAPNLDGGGPSTAAAALAPVGGRSLSLHGYLHPVDCMCFGCASSVDFHAECAEADAHDSYLTAIEGGW